MSVLSIVIQGQIAVSPSDWSSCWTLCLPSSEPVISLPARSDLTANPVIFTGF